jgi:hypothetical protein
MSSGIKEIIKTYIQVDDEIKSLNKQIKPLRMQKELLGEQISEYLKMNSESGDSVLVIGKDIFKITTTKRQKFLKDNLEEVLLSNTDEKVTKNILGRLFEESESSNLKRSTKKN